MARCLFVRFVGAATLVACTTQTPSPGVGALPQSTAIAQHLARGKSWMSPQAQTSDLVYVSDQGVWGHQGVYVYSYPAGTQVGFLQPDTEETYEGLCSDSAGNVFVVGWITNGQAFYDEYAHGATQPLKDIIASGVPSGCSLDPTSGNLAVANYQDFAVGRRGDIAIYQNASGSPTDYYDNSITYYYHCAYDDEGNLYADGNTDYLNELARKSSTLRHVYFNKRIVPGSLQWNAGALAVTVVGGAKGPTLVDRATVTGSGANIIGTTKLQTYHNKGIYLDVQFWIHKKLIIGPGPGSQAETRLLYFWPYPAGGNAFKILRAPGNSNFWGVTFSGAPRTHGG